METKQINVAGCAIVRDGALLLLHRIHPSHWELPGGKIDDGENAEAAAVREIKEELLCSAKIITKLGEHDFKDHSGYEMGYTWFRAELQEGCEPQIGEPEKFDDLAYIPLSELIAYTLSPNMQNFLAELDAERITLK